MLVRFGKTAMRLIELKAKIHECFTSFHNPSQCAELLPREGMKLRVDDMSKTYYAYDFKSPRTLDKPIKIVKTGRMWTKIDDSLLDGARFKSHLYETHTEIGDTTYIVRSVAPGTDDEKVIQEKVKRLILNNAKDINN